MHHIVALSGGKDSTAMALRLAEIEPQDYIYAITPTGDELPEMYDHWQRVATVLNKALTVVSSGRSLHGIIEREKALPNWRMRFCTRQLKIEPFQAFIIENSPATVYVGLRADESEDNRTGAVYGELVDVVQRYPLREWGWGLEDVWAYLGEKGVEIPERTDCARCFFQTLPEWYNLWYHYPELYRDAEQDEAAIGATYRSPGRDTWPASLAELRLQFEQGNIPRNAGQARLFDSRPMMCRACKM